MSSENCQSSAPSASRGYVFAWDDHGLDLDSISDSVENVRLKVLSETMGWRFNHPDRYSHDEEWQRLLIYGKVVSVLVSVDC
jgi:hypothetical protein